MWITILRPTRQTGPSTRQKAPTYTELLEERKERRKNKRRGR